ncbi:hypothetical protein A3F37_00895 [Candidatus Saccharibacteria bacterium RIFCSPHIGHO2_12_FULL_41_12]|nr:MAG: hypothetical protein A3F37_00895 [Candidatus Saccharibacteria bacterium RIFCSPHIGHO2_12_FULL_41_12]
MEALEQKPPALAEYQPGLVPDFMGPDFTVISGGGESTPHAGSLELVAPNESRLLGDVDDLARYRLGDGSYEPHAEVSVWQSKVTAVQEGAMPNAISNVEHLWFARPEGTGGRIMNLGRTAVETAMRGSMYYKSPETQARGDVEVEQARHQENTLRPGYAQIMISPRMTLKDATLEVAKAEGLAETDSIQVGWLDTKSDEQPKAVTNCLLAPDVPIQAWVKMFADEDNIFGKSITVEDPESALSVMKCFNELEVPVDKLPEGPLTILAEVVSYIEDPIARQKVTDHVGTFRKSDQQELKELATGPAKRWVKFDKSTEQSLRKGYANDEIRGFIDSLDGSWNDEDQETVERHKIVDNSSVGYLMTRELAEIVQKAEENLILTTTAVMVKNEKVIAQIEPEVVKIIRARETAVQQAQMANAQIHFYEINQHNINRTIASQKVRVGGGCNGENNAFGNSTQGETEVEMSWGVSLNSSSTRGRRDRRGLLKFKCQNGHPNTRDYGELIENCTTCGKRVKCK